MQAQKVKNNYLLNQLKQFSEKLGRDLKDEMQNIMLKLDGSNEIYNSSTDLMVYLIQNL
jgi:hypothetical protein